MIHTPELELSKTPKARSPLLTGLMAAAVAATMTTSTTTEAKEPV